MRSVFVCDECHAVFKKTFNLKRHKRRQHHSSCTFKCEESNKTFNTYLSLKKHKKTHTEVKKRKTTKNVSSSNKQSINTKVNKKKPTKNVSILNRQPTNTKSNKIKATKNVSSLNKQPTHTKVNKRKTTNSHPDIPNKKRKQKETVFDVEKNAVIDKIEELEVKNVYENASW